MNDPNLSVGPSFLYEGEVLTPSPTFCVATSEEQLPDFDTRECGGYYSKVCTKDISQLNLNRVAPVMIEEGKWKRFFLPDQLMFTRRVPPELIVAEKTAGWYYVWVTAAFVDTD